MKQKVRKEKISLEKKSLLPQFTPFSEDDIKPMGEASYEGWRYEEKFTMKDKIYSDNVIGQVIRKSLRGAEREK